MRKRILKSLVLLLSLVGVGFIGYPFVASLHPGLNTADPGYLVIDLNELDEDKPKVFEYNQHPILVLKHVTAEDQQLIRAYLGVPYFSDSLTVGCGVRPIDDYPGAKSINPSAVFYEPCRGVYYDTYGEILSGSHPNARQLRPVKIEIVGSKVQIGKFT